MLLEPRGLELAVVELDDLTLLDVSREFVALRKTGEGSAELLGVNFDVVDGRGIALDGFLDDLEGAIALEGDDVVDGAEIGGDVDLLAIHEHVTVIDELASPSAGSGEAHAINEVIETGFEDAEEGKTSDDGLIGFRDLEQAAELTLIHAIEGAEFLFFEKLGSVFGSLSLAVLAVLARAISSFLELVSSLKDGETEVTGFLPRRICVPRHY